MTEAEWLAIRSPAVLLDGVRAQHPRLPFRKLRLYLCACSRCLPDFTTAERLPEAVEAIEAFADGLTGLDQLNIARATIKGSPSHRDVRGRFWRLCECVLSSNSLLWDAVKQVANLAFATRAEQAILCTFVRDILGNPFRPVTLDPALPTPLVASLAQAAYDERHLPSGHLDAERLGVLADALEDVGADAALLEHLRAPGPHVRGCWVVDLLLGEG